MRTVLCLVIVTIAAGCSIALIGCEATARSDRMEPQWETTASQDKILAAPGTPSPLQRRKWPATQAAYTPCTVTHFGSYFNDEFVIRGDGDGAYGWTWMDVAAFGYCPGRFVVNVFAVPVSMIKEPPGVLVTTDLADPVDDEPEKSSQDRTE